MALGALGVSVIFSSGDGGVRGNHDDPSECTDNTFIPTFPAACPYVTAVGATIGLQPEVAVNFTGGGFSNVFAQPAWQAAAVAQFLQTLPADFAGSFNKSGRGYPDVRAVSVLSEKKTDACDIRCLCRASTSWLPSTRRVGLKAGLPRRRLRSLASSRWSTTASLRRGSRFWAS